MAQLLITFAVLTAVFWSGAFMFFTMEVGGPYGNRDLEIRRRNMINATFRP